MRRILIPIHVHLFIVSHNSRIAMIGDFYDTDMGHAMKSSLTVAVSELSRLALL